MIRTNRIQPAFHYDNIERDFVIVQVKKKEEDFWKGNLLDLPLQSDKALSAVYAKDSFCYLLYRRSEFIHPRLKTLMESADSTVTLQVVSSKKLQAHHLAQLLCNAMYQLLENEQRYQNTMGKLYIFPAVYRKKDKKTKKILSFWGLELRFTSTMDISLSVRTFSNQDYIDKKGLTPYLFNQKTGEFRKLLPSDKKVKQIYVQRALYSDHKNLISFLDFDPSPQHFETCKMGILLRFLQDAQAILGEYITLTLSDAVEGTTYSLVKNKARREQETAQIISILKAHPIYLQDLVLDETSAHIASLLEKELNQYFQISLCSGAPTENAFLIRIIHDKKYYQTHRLHDPYQDAPKNLIVQHVTTEHFKLNEQGSKKSKSKNKDNDKEDASLRKVLQELAIKHDLFYGKMTLFDWNRLGIDQPMWFVSVKNSPDADEKRFSRLKISPDGTLALDHHTEGEFSSDADWNAIELAYEPYRSNSTCFEGLYYFSLDHIHTIHRTEQFTLPNIEEIQETVYLVNPNEQLPLDRILACVQKAANESLEANDSPALNKLLELSQKNVYAKRKELASALNLRSKEGKLLNDIIFAKTGILISPRWKNQTNLQKYFDSVLNVQYYQTAHGIAYYAGMNKNDLQDKVCRACPVRHIETEDGIIENMDVFLSLLDVHFVRNEQCTVLPFPFKYLREWDLNE